MRAQTTLDFAIGVGLFLVTLGVVFTFVPAIVDPFTAGVDQRPLVTDRAATQLVSDTWANPDNPYVVEASDADAFFAAGESSAKDTLGIDASHVRITLTADGGGCPTGVSPCELGPPLPSNQDVMSAWRVVSVNGERADLRVWVW